MFDNNTQKLVKVALPLSGIKDALAYDKMPSIGPHPEGIEEVLRDWRIAFVGRTT